MPPLLRPARFALSLTAAVVIACGSDADAPPDPPSPPAPPPPPPAIGATLTMTTPPWDVGSTGATIGAWPRLVPGVRSRAVTSFDRGGGNDDGFAGTYSELYVDAATGEHVIFDATGPGVLRTLWMTSAVDGNAPLGVGTLRFYFDDEERPRVEIDADALFAGTTPPFVAPLVADNHVSSGGFASWAPLPYRSRLRVTTARRIGFYQIHHDELPADWDVASYAPGTVDDELVRRFEATSAPSTLPLEEATLDATIEGAGVIDVLRFVPTTTPTDAELAAARVRITFDGAPVPQIDVPLAFFFGSGFGLAPVRSIAWTITTPPSEVLFESRLPMPYWSGARVRVDGIAGRLLLHRAAEVLDRASTGTLEAILREDLPALAGDGDHVYADVTGEGKLVATVLGVDPLTAGNKGWWEGDVRTRLDGARSPAIHGTGHEDDHLGGWSNEFLSRPFSLPMQGAPRTELTDARPEVQLNGRTTLYRLWPGIGFSSSLRHSTEHGPSNARSANYASVAFVYRRAEPSAAREGRLVASDAFDVSDAAAASSHGLTSDGDGVEEAALESAFEGEDPTPRTMTVRGYTSKVRFVLAIDPANEGVVLRRVFDRAEVPSQATLLVDGTRVGVLRELGPSSPTRRWTDRDVFVPPQLTTGKTAITIELLPDTRLTATRFEAWSVRGAGAR